MTSRLPGLFVTSLFAAGALMAVPLAAGRSGEARADGPIQVTDAFARAAPAGGMGALYLTIVNTGPADRLTGAASPAIGKAELHESSSDNGVMRMRPVAGLDIPPAGSVKLAPGGYHFMLMGLKPGLSAGDQFPVTLRFAKAGNVEIEAGVVKPGSGAPAAQEMGPMQGMNPGMTRKMPPGMTPTK